jgi:Glycosyl hydrolase family 9
MKILKQIVLLFLITINSFSQLNYNFPNVQIVTSQLGFKPNSPKTITFFAKNTDLKFPDQIPFYVRQQWTAKKRKQIVMTAAQEKVGVTPFDYPIRIAEGKYENGPKDDEFVVLFKGIMKKKVTDWGTFWQADFSDFKQKGVFQIECEYATTTPFMVNDEVYNHLVHSYLNFEYGQRSGIELPGIRPMLHQDDGKLDTTGQFWAAAGGWYDAGDWRKYVTLTIGNIETLALVAQKGHPGFKKRAMDELRWGLAYYQQLVNDEGMVWEDTAGGVLKKGFTYENDWWIENHPGMNADASKNDSDGIPNTGDERIITTNYNPMVQYLFITNMCHAYKVVEPHEKGRCIFLAERVWNYAQAHNTDRRTLFVAEELRAATELYKLKSKRVTKEYLKKLLNELLERQQNSTQTLSGYFMEEGNKDGFRSLAYNSEPVLALLDFYEINVSGLEAETAKSKKAVENYITNYILKDAQNNIFGYTPYGVYTNPEHPELQKYRVIDKNYFVRSFIHLFSKRALPHGCGGVIMSHAYILAKAGNFFNQPSWQTHAEKLIQWSTGHNPEGLCLTTGVGFKHPTTINYVGYKTPDAFPIGFIGHPDDTPYYETSNQLEWSTQEQWDVPFYYLVDAISYLKK